MQLDLGRVTSVAGVALRSKWRSDELVTMVGLKVSDAENGSFVDVQGGELVTGINAFDDSTRALFLPTPVSARYIRIEALAWQNAVSLRAGVIVARAEAPPAVQPTDAASKAMAPASLFQGRPLHAFSCLAIHLFNCRLFHEVAAVTYSANSLIQNTSKLPELSFRGKINEGPV
jgi:hypothetical protein